MTPTANSPHEPDIAQIRRGVMRLGRRLRSERSGSALSSNKVSVLSHLHREGPMTPGDIAAADRQQPQSLTRTFAELELAGLIARARSERDRRESVLSLTAAGRRALSADMAERDIWLREALSELTDAEAAILQIAAALMDRLADADSAPDRRLVWAG